MARAPTTIVLTDDEAFFASDKFDGFIAFRSPKPDKTPVTFPAQYEGDFMELIIRRGEAVNLIETKDSV